MNRSSEKKSKSPIINTDSPSLLTTNKYFQEIDYTKIPIAKEYNPNFFSDSINITLQSSP